MKLEIGQQNNFKRRANFVGTNSVGVQSEDEAEGGCGGGNSAAPEPKRSPAALLGQSRSQQKSFLFLLEEKIRRSQIKKCEENFFAGWRAAAGRSVSFVQKRFALFQIKGTKLDFAVENQPRSRRGAPPCSNPKNTLHGDKIMKIKLTKGLK